eukprot:TRINITY_DN3356_c0_g1_i1.p1 TRINITY_DN3356_c0_g1~~TRINITY_DN3356_c0_g1_i1.p1  ORF type:complete len:252 (-),score=25.96 TRINITY_DN3356_c0_g1_i1:326-1081(-)
MLVKQSSCFCHMQYFQATQKKYSWTCGKKRTQISKLRALGISFAKEQLGLYEQRVDLKQRIQEEGAEEYAELRKSLIRNTQRTGGALTLYLYLVLNSTAAFCCMAGSIGSYLYVLLLVNDVDSLKQEDVQWWINIDKMRESPERSLLRAFSSYKVSLKPRLLIPAVLATGIWVYNNNSQVPLSLIDEAAILAGFLSYKGSLIVRLWKELKPRVEEIKASRPTLRDSDEDKYDIYGNLKEKINVNTDDDSKQ